MQTIHVTVSVQIPALPSQLLMSEISTALPAEINSEAQHVLPWPPNMSRISAAGAAQHNAVVLGAYGLMFDATEPKLASSWQHAQQLARDCRVLGYDDWRLPESHELALLIRHDRRKPSIDTDFFPHTPTNDWFWSNTPLKSEDASGSSCAWGVYFANGSVGVSLQSSTGFVRAVRRVAVPASQ